MPSYRRDSPIIELPPTNSWMVAGDNPYFIWDGDSQSFVSLSLSDAGSGSDKSLIFGAAEACSSPKPVNSLDWAEEVEEELFADGKSVTLFDVTAPAGTSKTGTEDGDPLSIVGSSTTPTFEELPAEIEDIPTHRSCNTIVEEDSKFADEDEDEGPGEIQPKEELPLNVNDERRESTALADPLVGTGFGVDDLGYPLHACKDPTAAFLESVAKDDDVSSLVIVDPESLDGGYVMVDMTGMCVTPEGVEVGKHRDLLRRWKSAMKRGFSNTPILVSSKAPSKYRISNSNYAKHKAQFHSVVCVTVVQSQHTLRFLFLVLAVCT